MVDNPCPSGLASFPIMAWLHSLPPSTFVKGRPAVGFVLPTRLTSGLAESK